MATAARGAILAMTLSAGYAMAGPIDLEAALAKPVSPGSIALLVEHVSDERARERLRTAIRDPRTDVRAAAARVLFAGGARTLLPELERALAEEIDIGAASELARAVASWGGPAKSEVVLETAERLHMAGAVGMVLAAAHQHRALEHLLRLRRLDPEFPLEDFLRVASRVEANGDQPARFREPSPTSPILRTVDGFPSGFVSDLLEVTDCQPEKGAGFGIADVRFSMDGRPLRATIQEPADVPTGCVEASRALILSSVVPANRLKREANWDRLLIVIDPEVLACISGDPLPLKAPVRPGNFEGTPKEVRPPKKIEDVRPMYPQGAKQDRAEGIVILEATIDRSGCVRDLRILRSIDERLDVAGALAVSRWKYEPTRVDGEPSAILMTVTVSFRLS